MSPGGGLRRAGAGDLGGVDDGGIGVAYDHGLQGRDGVRTLREFPEGVPRVFAPYAGLSDVRLEDPRGDPDEDVSELSEGLGELIAAVQVGHPVSWLQVVAQGALDPLGRPHLPVHNSSVVFME